MYNEEITSLRKSAIFITTSLLLRGRPSVLLAVADGGDGAKDGPQVDVLIGNQRPFSLEDVEQVSQAALSGVGRLLSGVHSQAARIGAIAGDH